jgi:hypothetical protein
VELAVKTWHLAERGLAFGDVPQQVPETLWIDGLCQVIVGALFHGRHGGVHAALRGNHHERKLRELILDASQQLEAVHSAA